MANNHVWHLVARKLSGEATLDELRELEQALREDPELAYQVDLYSGFYEGNKPQRRDVEEKVSSWNLAKSKLANEFPDAFHDTREIPAPKINYKKWLAAASVLILMSVGFIFFLNERNKETSSLSNTLNEMKTMPGTRTKMVLPDGTQVWLNSDSYITYNKDFGRTKREITLRGEAFFDVFHNMEVPMIVHARSVNIVVKGTAFNVRNYPESPTIETSLIRGSVELTTNEDPSRKILLKPNEKITIDAKPVAVASKKNERAPVIKPSYYHIDALKESAISNTIPEISWVENKLVFDNETFSEVILKMQKWYNVRFVLKNEELAAKKFSGAFEKETVYEALSALQMINHFEFTSNGNEIIIK